MTLLTEIASNALLFSLVFGMSATVDIENLKKQLGNGKALMTGLALQFVVLPFLGFAVVNALKMDSASGITLLVVTSSPGGSYSNWWCSMFNADLALSVTMTAISTLMSVIMLPLNLILYATTSYSGEVVKSLDWTALFVSLVVVIGGIGTGLLSSAYIHSHKFNLLANKLGNVAGIALVAFSVFVSSSGHEANLWDQNATFYIGVAAPCVLGLFLANLMASSFNLRKPERVTVSVECCYQNTGIATSVAITMFAGEELAEAIGVPLFYGIVEAVTLGIYCLLAWKINWTKAPADESLCVVIVTSYEVEEAELLDDDAIEVVYGLSKEGLPEDLIFKYDHGQEAYTIDPASLEAAAVPEAALGDEVMDPDLQMLRSRLRETEKQDDEKYGRPTAQKRRGRGTRRPRNVAGGNGASGGESSSRYARIMPNGGSSHLESDEDGMELPNRESPPQTPEDDGSGGGGGDRGNRIGQKIANLTARGRRRRAYRKGEEEEYDDAAAEQEFTFRSNSIQQASFDDEAAARTPTSTVAEPPTPTSLPPILQEESPVPAELHQID